MVRQVTSFFLMLLFAGALASNGVAQTAFVNANVLTLTDDEVRDDWTVVVDGDRIVAAGPSDEVDVPSSAAQIDASGKYLIPGLAEMHGHVPSLNESEQYVDDVLFLFVANGITTVRGMLGSEGQLELREATNSGQRLGPSLYLAGPAFSGGSIDSPEQAAVRVREQHAAGWDYLKVLPGLTVAEYDAMANTANEVGIPFIGHVPSEVGLAHAIEMGQQTVDHIDGYTQFLEDDDEFDFDRLDEAVDMTLEHGVWLIPTMALWETIIGKPETSEIEDYEELDYMPADMVAGWIRSHNQRRGGSFDQTGVDRLAEARIRVLKALNDADARILLGTDAPQQFSVPGFSLIREFPLMLDAGMSPYEILVSGTRSVGEYFEDKDTFGTIEEGSRADLVLLNANPLDDIMHTFDRAGVMVRGTWLSESEIQRRLAEIAGRSE